MQRNPSRTRNSRSPSSEARQSDITNKNGFGDKTGTSDEFGWPGLGTWTTSSDSSTQAKLTQNKTDPTSPHPPTAHAISNRDKRLEQVLQEAIDEAADESYGWPGLGGWPSSGKRS
ncbi:hypothetical protein H2198_010721 [Neophaeococcomyces mojaviensis]|uniref:Uncharacterized protein n=1 Tax=Neophaeococcomyces mojaviensis TaxID=3383035 RepID=A0ACC2ZRD6_9EURO|nr:hypothetical protein H2198_010721 [Knufia sp. JES_112]